MLRGNPGQRKLHPEPVPEIAKTCPEPPSFITGYAADEWWSVAPELHRLGLLTSVDVASLAAYCQAYGHWRTAEEALARMADRDEHMHGLLIKTVDGNARRNPLVKIAADAAEDMLRFAGEFGLTPVARTGSLQAATPSHHRHRSSTGYWEMVLSCQCGAAMERLHRRMRNKSAP
jgi:P27 family predicted phage terminase small subunit